MTAPYETPSDIAFDVQLALENTDQLPARPVFLSDVEADILSSLVGLLYLPELWEGISAWQDVDAVKGLVDLLAFKLAGGLMTGFIFRFGGEQAPPGYLLCDGSEVERAEYPFLFEVIGLAHGLPGNGTLFKLPDLTAEGSYVIKT